MSVRAARWMICIVERLCELKILLWKGKFRDVGGIQSRWVELLNLWEGALRSLYSRSYIIKQPITCYKRPCLLVSGEYFKAFLHLAHTQEWTCLLSFMKEYIQEVGPMIGSAPVPNTYTISNPYGYEQVGLTLLITYQLRITLTEWYISDHVCGICAFALGIRQ